MKVEASKEGKKLNLELKALITLEDIKGTSQISFSREPDQTVAQPDSKVLIGLYKEILSEIRELRKALMVPRRRLLDIKETAIYLGIAARTIRNKIGPKAVQRFPVKPLRIGGKVLFRQEDLDRFIDEMAAEHAGTSAGASGPT
jgi:predicted DNA-binding transcriptional regulator AlpA